MQAAVNQAQLGDTIILEAGGTYMGPITLPKKDGDTYLTIRTSNLPGISKEGERINPSQAGAMPKILSPANDSAVRTADQAHHYKFIGVEFSSAPNAAYVYNLINLGDDNYKSIAQFPHHLVFDRCYVHSPALNKIRRGIALNSGEASVLNSYVSGFAGAGDETQAIAGWNGPGHFISSTLRKQARNRVVWRRSSIQDLSSDIEFVEIICFDLRSGLESHCQEIWD